jgi:hypothetical protein
MEQTNILKCRKCGGEHLTIKCGKTLNTNNIKNTNNDINNDVNRNNRNNDVNININNTNNRNNYINRNNDINRNNRNNYINRNKNNKTQKVKLVNMPSDISKEEMYDLLRDWGNIKSIYIKELTDINLIFIEFENLEQASYFVDSIDSTAFDHKIIKAELVL